MIDLKVVLVERFGWSLKAIAETDIEDLLPFVYRLAEKTLEGSPDQQTRPPRRTFVDQVEGW